MTTTTSTDLDAAVAEIRRRVETQQRAALRAEGERDAAQAAADTARRQLAEEFGVDNVADARLMLERLEADLTQEIIALDTALDTAAGGGR